MADKVQVGGAQRVEGTAVVNRQVLFIGLGHILGQGRADSPHGCPLSTDLSNLLLHNQVPDSTILDQVSPRICPITFWGTEVTEANGP